MNRSEAFQSGYLKQDDIDRPTIATIKAVGMELVGSEENGEYEKPVMYFTNGSTNGTKPMVINRVNWDILEHAYGSDSEKWVGKPIELFIDPNVLYRGKKVGGVRIRIPAGDSAPINFEKAQGLAREAGGSPEELIQFLKSKGRVNYNAARDSGLVREFLASKSQHVPAGEDIPF